MDTAHRAVATDDRRLTQTPYRMVYCGGFYVLGGFHKRHLFFLSLCIRVSAIIRLLVHIDALVLIPSTGFKENFLRFLEVTTNGHQLEKEQTTTDYTDSTDYARSALERKSSVGATLLYGVRRLGAAFGKLTTN